VDLGMKGDQGNPGPIGKTGEPGLLGATGLSGPKGNIFVLIKNTKTFLNTYECCPRVNDIE